MAANTLFSQPFLYVVDADGVPIVGAEATFFEAGTSTPLDVFTDPDLNTAWGQPIVTNAAGQSDGPIYVSPTPAIKIVIVDAAAVPVSGFPMDFWSPSAVAV
jgi:hypothetical protein